MSSVASVEPASTKMCSTSWQVWRCTEASVSASVAALFQVQVTIEKAGLFGIELQDGRNGFKNVHRKARRQRHRQRRARQLPNQLRHQAGHVRGQLQLPFVILVGG